LFLKADLVLEEFELLFKIHFVSELRLFIFLLLLHASDVSHPLKLTFFLTLVKVLRFTGRELTRSNGVRGEVEGSQDQL